MEVHNRTMAESAGHLEGVLLIDKPAGISSHDVVDRVRKLFGLRKVGHTGTLDPFATGVMVVCVGRATRVAKYFEGMDKAYRAVIKLGEVTDTGDSDGVVVEVSNSPIGLSRELLEAAIDPFRGTITQQPPAYSAVKVGGERLYAKAR
ncbi:MAG: tRNA pseudouridine(55) synthase TruB, partial [bacterium]